MVAEILDVFKTRLSSPILMSIFVSFVLLNWQAFYYVLFSGAPAISSVQNWWQTSRFDYWEEYMVWWRYFIPIPIGLAYALLGPKISFWGAKMTSKDINAKRMLEKEEASKILELEAELQAARNLAASAFIDQAELKERASNIKDETLRDELEENIKSLDGMPDESVLPFTGLTRSDVSIESSPKKTSLSVSENDISNIKEIDIEDHENFDENARKLEIELRYKALHEEAQAPTKRGYEIFSSVKDLRKLEGPKYDPHKINVLIDGLLGTAKAIAVRLEELDYGEDPIIYEQMSDEYNNVTSKILAKYKNLEFDDDIPF